MDNLDSRLRALKRFLINNPNYLLPEKLHGNLKYVAASSLYLDKSKILDALIMPAKGYYYIPSITGGEEFNPIKAIDIILESEHFHWDYTYIGLTKYASYILEETLNLLTPLEWINILIYDN